MGDRGFKPVTKCGRAFKSYEFQSTQDKKKEQKRFEIKESTKYSVLETKTSTLFNLTTSDNLQDSSVI